MSITECFSQSYAEARQKFIDTCRNAGLTPVGFKNPESGPNDEELFTDVVRAGADDAAGVFIAISATHGVEGFCGSGSLIGYLDQGLHREIPDGLAVVLVHAINPYGFAHERRVTEGNIDLNRNFLDHAAAYPENPAYDDLHEHIVPTDWDGPARAAADQAIADLISSRGEWAYQSALQPGQYAHPDGLFFGGHAPTWSNGILREIIATHCTGCKGIAFIDFHTGLGPRGYGEPIFAGSPDSPAYRRARDWYGDDVTCPAAGDSTSTVVQGTTASAFADAIGDAELTPIALEYGTLPLSDVLGALRADNWLYLHGEVDSPIGREIKTAIREAFYGDDDAWKQMIWERAAEFYRKALAGLLES